MPSTPSYSLPEKPMYLFAQDDADFLCCAGGVYRVPAQDANAGDGTGVRRLQSSEGSNPKSPFKVFSLLDDDDDDDVMEVEKQPVSNNVNNRLEMVYKYKKPARAFSKTGRLLFSLHSKTKTTCYVECTDVGAGGVGSGLKCSQACCLMLESEAAATAGQDGNDDGWIFSLEEKRVNTEVKGKVLVEAKEKASAAAGHVFLFVGDKSGGCCSVVAVDAATGAAASGVARNVEIGSVGEVFARAYENMEVEEEKGSDLDIVELVRQRQRADVAKFVGTLPAEEVLAVQAFAADGFLLLTAGGKVWQYHKVYGDLTKTLLPVLQASMMSVCGARATVLTRNFWLYHARLPYALPTQAQATMSKDKKAAGAGMARVDLLTPAQMVSQIVENAKELERVNAVRAQQERLMSQLRMATEIAKDNKAKDNKAKDNKAKDNKAKDNKKAKTKLLALKTAVKTRTCLALSTTHELHLEVTNESEFTFDCAYWSLDVSLTSKASPNVVTKLQLRLPEPSLQPGRVWSAFLALPEELVRLDSLPILVDCDLVFACSHSRGDVEVRAGVMQAAVTTLDLMRVVSKADQGLAADQGSSSADATADSADSIEWFIDRLARSRPLHDGREDAGENGGAVREFTLRLPTAFLTRLAWKPFVAQLREVISDSPPESAARVELVCRLQGARTADVRMTVEFLTEGFAFTCTCASKRLLLAVKRDLLRLKMDLAEEGEEDEEGGVVGVPRAVVAAAHALQGELSCLGDEEDTEEGVATLRRCYRRAREEVSSKLA